MKGEIEMEQKAVEIAIYGAEQLCASCVNLPSSIDTYEWIQAAISRKFPNQPFTFTYIDIHQPPEEEDKKQLAQKIIEEDLFYPVLAIEGKILAEGNIRLKNIYTELQNQGYTPIDL